MPLIDSKLLFGTDQAVTASAASTDYLDLGAAGSDAFGTSQVHDKFTGKVAYLNILVTEAATASGAATVTVALEGDSSSGFATALVQYMATMAIPKASLTVGTRIRMPVPGNFRKRYLRVYFTVATGPLTAGKFTTWLDTD